MKKSFFIFLLLLLVSGLASYAQNSISQSGIMFKYQAVKGTMSDGNTHLLNRHLEHILSRNKALAADAETPFCIKAEIIGMNDKTSDSMHTYGFTVTGDLILSAVNLQDGTVYYTVTTPLSASGSVGTARTDSEREELLINAINSHNQDFVLFIHNARKAIADYFASK